MSNSTKRICERKQSVFSFIISPLRYRIQRKKFYYVVLLTTGLVEAFKGMSNYTSTIVGVLDVVNEATLNS